MFYLRALYNLLDPPQFIMKQECRAWNLKRRQVWNVSKNNGLDSVLTFWTQEFILYSIRFA